MTHHSVDRLCERYHMSKQAFLDAYRKAIQSKNYVIRNDPKYIDRAIVMFSRNTFYLYKIVISKIDGAILTILPVRNADFDLAIYYGLIDRKREIKGVF